MPYSGGGGGGTTASTSWAYQGDISPSQLTGNQNDYNPTGLADASTMRLTSDASRNITGLAGGADGRVMFIHNIGSNNIVLIDESSSSSAANRFALNGDITLGADNAVLLQYDATSSRWRAVSVQIGASGAGAHQLDATAAHTDYLGASLYLPDWPPSSAGSLDDEFGDNSGAVPGGWTEWDPGSVATITEGAQGVKFVNSTTAGNSWAGMFKLAPASPYAIITRVHLLSRAGVGYFLGGLMLGQDLTNNPTTSDLFVNTIAYFPSDGATISRQVKTFVATYSAYNDGTGTVHLNEENRGWGPRAYLRIRVNGTTASSDISMDGVTWVQVDTRTIGFTPAEVGVVFNNNAGGADIQAYFGFFRNTASDALDVPLAGRRVSLAAS